MDPGHLLIDRHGAILEADAAFGLLMRVLPCSLRGRDVLSLTASADRPGCADAIHGLLTTRRSFDLTKRFVREDDTVVWARNSVSLMSVGTVEVIVATCAYAPPQEIRRAPAALLESARAQLAMIEDRTRVGDRLLLVGPNWNTLLQVFIAEAEGRTVDLSSLAATSGQSREVMRRWVAVLIKAGLLETETRASDPYSDKSYRLTPAAVIRLEAHLVRYAAAPDHLLGASLV